MSVKTFAAIDVGSYELTMKIFELSGKNNMREIDHISQRLDLGSDTYATGKLGAEKIDELCRALKEFSAIMKSYGVDAYKAYATSAIREAGNSTIVLDQIAQRAGIKTEILSNSEQRFLDYKSVASRGESFRRIIEEKTAVVDIGGGSIQLSLFDNDTLVSTQNLLLGVLRIQEVMHPINVSMTHLERLVDEMASELLTDYKKLYLKDREFQNIIVVDDYISPWAVRYIKEINRKEINNKEVTNKEMLDLSDFEGLIGTIRTKSPAEAARILDITEERVPLVFYSAILTRRIAELMGAEKIWAPGVTLSDGIAYEYGESLKMFKGEHDFEKDILASAMNISKRYMGSRKRAENMERITIEIFDSMKKIHGMGKREKLYLRLASMLHECGRYISMMNIGETGYDIIMVTEIIGLSHKEREILANIVRFAHGRYIYFDQAVNTDLDRQSYLIVAKLTAILRLGISMDRSSRQKLKSVKAVLKDNELYLSTNTMEDITLEAESFADNRELFQEVFSVTPVLKQYKSF